MRLAIDAVGAKFGGAATVLLDVVQAALADERLEQLIIFTSPRACTISMARFVYLRDRLC